MFFGKTERKKECKRERKRKKGWGRRRKKSPLFGGLVVFWKERVQESNR